MEWIDFALENSTITIIFLVLCLLFLNFGSILWALIIGVILFVLSKFI
ncbi:MAG: hypothetical protein H6Q68_2591 [Firmicutes bacterium]|nr:hypothetical protein [Bacillota bacterium]